MLTLCIFSLSPRKPSKPNQPTSSSPILFLLYSFHRAVPPFRFPADFHPSSLHGWQQETLIMNRPNKPSNKCHNQPHTNHNTHTQITDRMRANSMHNHHQHCGTSHGTSHNMTGYEMGNGGGVKWEAKNFRKSFAKP